MSDNDLLQNGASAEEVREKLRRLSEQILTLGREIPEIAELASTVEITLGAVQADLTKAMILVERLSAKCERWSQDLAGRYTFLVNLKGWLVQQNGLEELIDDSEGTVGPSD